MAQTRSADGVAQCPSSKAKRTNLLGVSISHFDPERKSRPSSHIGFDDSFSECLRRFLGQVVANAAGDDPMLVPTRKLLGVSAGLGVRSAIGVAFERDGRHGNIWACCESLVQIVIPRFASGEAEAPAIIVDYDRDMVRIVESRGGTFKRRVV